MPGVLMMRNRLLGNSDVPQPAMIFRQGTEEEAAVSSSQRQQLQNQALKGREIWKGESGDVAGAVRGGG